MHVFSKHTKLLKNTEEYVGKASASSLNSPVATDPVWSRGRMTNAAINDSMRSYALISYALPTFRTK